MSSVETPPLESAAEGRLQLPPGGGSRERLATLLLVAGVVVSSIALGGIAVWNPLFAIAVVAAAALGLAVLIRPELGTMVTLFLVYASVPAVAVNSQDLPQAVGALVPFLLVIPAAYFLWRGQAVIFDRNLGLIVLLFAGSVASSLTAVDQDVALRKMLTLALEGIITYFLIVNVVRTKSSLRMAIWTLLAVGAMLSSLSVLQAATGTFDLPYGGFALVGSDFFRGLTDTPRLAGPLGDPNYYAQILVALVPMALLRMRDETSPLLKLTAATTVGLLLAAIGLTYSRGAALALGAILVLMVVYRYTKVRNALLAAVAAGLLIASIPDLRDRVTSISDVGASATSVEGDNPEADESVRARWTETRAAALAFADQPILGVGPENFPLVYQEYAARIGVGIHTRVRSGEARGEIPEREAHNLFVGIAADLGLVGLIAFLAILWTAMSGLSRIRRRAAAIDPEIANYATSFFLALVAYSCRRAIPVAGLRALPVAVARPLDRDRPDRSARAAERSGQGRAQERRDPVELSLERLASCPRESLADQGRAQICVEAEALERVDGRLGVVGGNEQPVALMLDRARDPADRGRHDRCSGGLRLGQHLRQPLGARHVQERVRAPVLVPELRAVRDVTG